MVGEGMIAHLRRWRWFYASILIGGLAGERFPFSNWPMYSSFSANSGYVYVTDASGAPLAHLATFGESSARLKKQFNRDVGSALAQAAPPGRDEARRRSGQRLLTRLAARLTASRQQELGGLQLVYVTIRYAGGGLRRDETTVATLALAPPGTP
jgi:hypothetical protein